MVIAECDGDGTLYGLPVGKLTNRPIDLHRLTDDPWAFLIEDSRRINGGFTSHWQYSNPNCYSISIPHSIQQDASINFKLTHLNTLLINNFAAGREAVYPYPTSYVEYIASLQRELDSNNQSLNSLHKEPLVLPS